MPSQSTLLRGGVLLIHDSADHVVPTRSDLLIEGGRISQIGADIQLGPSTTVLDCTGKIISPGFVDTHHHVWQTQLKGRHADETLSEYIYSGLFAGSLFSPSDIFWGELSGTMEAVDAGTTTVVDHAHHNYSTAHTREAIRATIASGIRSIYCYSPTPRVATWAPTLTIEKDLLPDWVMEELVSLASTQPFGDGRVRLGFGFDGLYLPESVLGPLFKKVRDLGIKLITIHYLNSASFGENSKIALMESYKILASDVLFSHATNPVSGDAALLSSSGASVSSTPSSELHMGHGNHVCLQPEFYPHSSLGIDCHSSASSYIPGQMNLALQSSRGMRHEKFEAAGKSARHVGYTVEQVFNLGTILGARAIKMEAEIGSLKVGKRADLVVFDALSPGMLAAAQHDPVAAIVLHSSIRDVVTVIIDGVIRKENGVLKDVRVSASDDTDGSHGIAETISWKTVAGKVLQSRDGIEEKVKSIDMGIARKGALAAFYISEEAFSEEL